MLPNIDADDTRVHEIHYFINRCSFRSFVAHLRDVLVNHGNDRDPKRYNLEISCTEIVFLGRGDESVELYVQP